MRKLDLLLIFIANILAWGMLYAQNHPYVIIKSVTPQPIRLEAVLEAKLEPTGPQLVQAQSNPIVDRIRRFLTKKRSPLAPYSNVIVSEARRYGIDPRLIVAIACKESSCGKRLVARYNPFGRRAIGGGWMRFSSWGDAVANEAAYLSEPRYRTSIENIGKIYCPYTWQEWSRSVTILLGQI